MQPTNQTGTSAVTLKRAEGYWDKNMVKWRNALVTSLSLSFVEVKNWRGLSSALLFTLMYSDLQTRFRFSIRSGWSNIQPMGQNRPVTGYKPARGRNLESVKWSVIGLFLLQPKVSYITVSKVALASKPYSEGGWTHTYSCCDWWETLECNCTSLQ